MFFFVCFNDLFHLSLPSYYSFLNKHVPISPDEQIQVSNRVTYDRACCTKPDAADSPVSSKNKQCSYWNADYEIIDTGDDSAKCLSARSLYASCSHSLCCIKDHEQQKNIPRADHLFLHSRILRKQM